MRSRDFGDAGTSLQQLRVIAFILYFMGMDARLLVLMIGLESCMRHSGGIAHRMPEKMGSY